MKNRLVKIIGGGHAYQRMFEQEGWIVSDELRGVDLIQFTGGEDVTPSLYGERKHKLTGNNPDRDAREQAVFNYGVKNKIAMAGICRGGQFLNVMCGGKMWQHVEGHAMLGTHECIDVFSGEAFQVTSTHHQMMRPGVDGVMIGKANISKCREEIYDGKLKMHFNKHDDPEIVYYGSYNCLCFQPHPEFDGYKALRKKYFDYLEAWCFYEGDE